MSETRQSAGMHSEGMKNQAGMNEAKTSGKRQGKLSQALDGYFHFTERGSSAGREVKAGLSVFFLSVCALFMNIQILIGAFADDIPYCGLYLGATLAAFIGTLLLGFVANLPLVQTASLSLSTVMISTVGAESGLTYANLMAVTFVAAVVYLVVMVIPALRKFVYRLLPDSVRKALPAAIGLYIALTALKNMGILGDNGIAGLTDEALGGATIAPYMRLCVIAGLIAFALVVLLKKLKSDTPVFTGFLWATLIFFLIASVIGGIAFNYVFTQNRIWVGVNPDPLGEMYTIGLGISELQLGTLFTQGFDFSAYTAAGGNVALLFVEAILLFLFMGMYESEASLQGADLNGEIIPEGKYETAAGKVLLVNAVTNVVAPLVGSAPLSVGKQSAAAAADGGKTGLSSVVCAIGYLVSMFTWLPFVIFATYTASVPEYGHAGFVFPNVIYATFQIADAVMLFLGLTMLKAFKNVKDTEIIPFAVTVVMTGATGNIAYGAAAGVIAAVFMALASFKKEEIRAPKASGYTMAVLSVAILAMVFSTTGAVSADSTATGTDGTQSAQSGSGSAGGTEGTGGTDASDGSMVSGENSAGFSFDGTSGDFSFTGDESAEYYTVWVYSVDAEGNESDSYVAASSRLTGTGEITGNVDVSGLAFGTYHANLNTFSASGTNPDPAKVEFTVGGKLSTPEFMYTQDGTNVTVTVFSDTLTTYNEQEMFTDIDINIYDESGAVVTTETITEDDLTVSAMGPMSSYSCEKAVTLEPGDYQISLTAKGDGSMAEASDESEKLSLVVADGAVSEGKTSGYAEQEGGMPPM